MQILLTEHAVKRARKRLGWSHHALLRMTDQVIHFGLGPERTRGSLHRYLQIKERDEAVMIRTYGEHVFVFQRGDSAGAMRLLTVMHLPLELRPKVRQQMHAGRCGKHSADAGMAKPVAETRAWIAGPEARAA